MSRQDDLLKEIHSIMMEPLDPHDDYVHQPFTREQASKMAALSQFFRSLLAISAVAYTERFVNPDAIAPAWPWIIFGVAAAVSGFALLAFLGGALVPEPFPALLVVSHGVWVLALGTYMMLPGGTPAYPSGALIALMIVALFFAAFWESRALKETYDPEPF